MLLLVQMSDVTSRDTAAVDKLTSSVSQPAAADSSSAARISVSDNEVSHTEHGVDTISQNIYINCL